MPAAVVGVLVFLYGVITMNYNQVALEVCTEGDKFVMCPLCGECDDWVLSDICVYKKVAYLFDHPGTVFYAIFMSFWGKDHILIWKRFYDFFEATYFAHSDKFCIYQKILEALCDTIQFCRKCIFRCI